MIVYSLLVYSNEKSNNLKINTVFEKGSRRVPTSGISIGNSIVILKNLLLLVILINPHCFPKIHLLIPFASIIIVSKSKRLSSI